MKFKSFQSGIFLGILIGAFITIVTVIIVSNQSNVSNTDYLQYSTIKPELQIQSTQIGGNKININDATVDELMELPGIGEQKAKSIVDFRTKYGEFLNIDELLYIRGIGNSLFESIRDSITVK